MKNKVLRVTVHDRSKKGKGKKIGSAEGSLIKYIEKKPEPRKYNLIRASYDNLERQNELCPAKKEPTYVSKKRDKYQDFIEKKFMVRGLPKMQVRLVYDTDEYPVLSLCAFISLVHLNFLLHSSRL